MNLRPDFCEQVIDEYVPLNTTVNDIYRGLTDDCEQTYWATLIQRRHVPHSSVDADVVTTLE